MYKPASFFCGLQRYNNLVFIPSDFFTFLNYFFFATFQKTTDFFTGRVANVSRKYHVAKTFFILFYIGT